MAMKRLCSGYFSLKTTSTISPLGCVFITVENSKNREYRCIISTSRFSSTSRRFSSELYDKACDFSDETACLEYGVHLC